MKKMHLPLVIITWEDHNSIDPWQSSEEARSSAVPKIITSVGWLHHQTEKVYSIVSCACEDGDISCQQNLVKAAVVDFYTVPGSKKKPGKVRASKPSPKPATESPQA